MRPGDNKPARKSSDPAGPINTLKQSIAAAAAVTAAFGATAAIVATSAHVTELSHPPTGRFLDVSGVRVHYLDEGSGPPLVLIHGNAMSSLDFVASGILAPLAQRHRVIVVDRPGFGYTARPSGTEWTLVRQAELLYRLLEALKVAHPIVVGHSLGSLVAVALAIAHPKYARALVLLSGYYYSKVSPGIAKLARPTIPVIGLVMQYTVSPVVALLMEPAITQRLFEPSPVAESFAKYPLAMSRRPSQMHATLEDAAFMDGDAAKLVGHYGELTLPIEILAGDGDKIVDTIAQSERLSHDLPHAHFSTIAGAGHMIEYIAPERVLAAIDAVEWRSSAFPA